MFLFLFFVFLHSFISAHIFAEVLKLMNRIRFENVEPQRYYRENMTTLKLLKKHTYKRIKISLLHLRIGGLFVRET